MEWLDREEEIVGLDAVMRGTVDEKTLRELLYEELGYEPTEGQLGAWQQAGQAKFEQLPQVGVAFERLEQVVAGQVWGYRPAYRDITTGRFISLDDVMAARRAAGLIR
ncbi:unnamed protein product [marine sediment metagenome]|uniref:Uncharacterized protein n=1 Tax=marine sediment metagenome TaxID=412755 RepID=X1QB17_9ZZZZ